MTDPSSRAERQAHRLLRFYPREWRARYGDEFGELLVADIADRPGAGARSINVAFSGIMARLACAGLSGTTVDPADGPRRRLASFGGVLAVLLVFGVSIWSQLDVARRSASPTAGGTRHAIFIMTVALALSLAATSMAVVPLAWRATVTGLRQPVSRRPVVMFWSATAALVGGGLVFRHGWPNGGATPWAHSSLGPGGVLGFLWASTIAISAYWIHPSTMLRFPVMQIAWMCVSPLTLVLAVTAAVSVLRRIEVPAPLLRFVGVTGGLAVAGFGLFLLGTLIWLVDGTPGPGRMFQPGTVDLIGFAVMCAALALAALAVVRTCRSLPSTVA